MAKTRPSRTAPATPSATSVSTKISASVGVVAAMLLAVLINALVARHYRRWDWTRGGLYTLSDATLQTLRGLEEPVEIHVLLGTGDPLTLSIEHLLAAYGAETTRLQVKRSDPDRHPAEFLAVQQRFGIVPGKTEDGRIVTDAAIVVVRGDKPYFVTHRDLVDVEDEQDLQSRPRLEQALTAAIRNVTSGERPKACFATGHGEKSTDAGGDVGAAPLRDKLSKNNYEVIEVPSVRALGAEKDPLPACRLLVIAGPSERVPPEDVARFKTFVERGGNALVFVGPVPDTDDKRYLDLGLDELLAVAGVRLEKDFVFELDPKHRSTQGFGETFLPMAKPHPVTEGLMKLADRGLSVVMTVASSLSPTGAGSAAPAPLLVTSDKAFGMVDFFAWAEHPTAPTPGAADRRGPLTIAFASELPRPATAPPPGPGEPTHGARIVVVGSSSVVLGANWHNEELRGAALFVESAVSWAAARPVILDIPNKPSFVAGLRVTDDNLAAIFRRVVLYIPLASVLLGVAVHLRRRSTERPSPGPRPERRRRGTTERRDDPD